MRYQLNTVLGESKIVNGIVTIDNSMIPDDIKLLKGFFDDATWFIKDRIRACKQMILAKEKANTAWNEMSLHWDVDTVTIFDQLFEDAPDLELPKSEFLRLLDELAAAIDTGKDIWIEKSDEGKYRIWGE